MENAGQGEASRSIKQLIAKAWHFLGLGQTPVQLVLRDAIKKPASQPLPQGPMVEPNARPILRGRLVEPTESEADAGLRKLLRCISVWKATEGLLIMKPHIAAIVSVREVAYTRHGFQLAVEIEDYLVAEENLPEGLRDKRLLRLGCMWNQPYMSFGERNINAPYSFRLTFDQQGMAGVRRFQASLPTKEQKGMSVPGPWELCLDITEEKFQTLLARESGWVAGDVEGAIAELRAEISRQPNSPFTHYTLGSALAAKGESDSAIAEFRTALNQQPKLSFVHYHLGNALVAKGDLDGAIAEYCAGISKQPNFPEAQSALDKALAIKEKSGPGFPH